MKAIDASIAGQQRFNIYCYVCHGYDGSGHGPVNQRAMELKAIDTDPQHPLGDHLDAGGADLPAM